MPIWFYLALLCFTVTGVQSVLLLRAAKSGVDSRSISGVMVWAQLPPLLLLYFLGLAKIDSISAVIPALLVSVAFYISLIARQKWLEAMDGGTYFLMYRIWSSLCLFTLGVLYFHEHITVTNGIGIILWFLALYFLTDRKDISSNFRFWLIMVGIWALCILVLNGFQKYIALQNIEPLGFTLLTSIFAAVVTCKDIRFWSFKNSMSSLKKQRDVFIIGGIASLLGLTSYIGGIYAYKTWGDLVIIYKIVSFSLILPMIYSVLFLGEKITRAKIFALGLTVVSMYFLT